MKRKFSFTVIFLLMFSLMFSSLSFAETKNVSMKEFLETLEEESGGVDVDLSGFFETMGELSDIAGENILEDWTVEVDLSEEDQLGSDPEAGEGLSDSGILTKELVTDFAGYLTEEEKETLSYILENIVSTYNIEVAIYTENNMSGASASQTADDIFDYNGYGFGYNSDGMLLYICDDTREYWITTHGKAREIFTDDKLEKIENKMLGELSDDDYYKGFIAFAEESEKILKGENSPFFIRAFKESPIPISAVILIPLIFAFIMMFSQLKKMKTAVKEELAKNYVKQGSLILPQPFIQQVSSHTNRFPKAKSSSSHRSSSGRIHGGRGGRF